MLWAVLPGAAVPGHVEKGLLFFSISTLVKGIGS